MVDKKFVVTPWEVTGEVDYERLIRDFGTQPISGPLATRLEGILGDAAYLVRRQIFFSHRDLNLVLEDYAKGKGLFLYTGRGPSGPMHVGHIGIFYFTKWLQDKFQANVYIQITDDEKFLEERRNLSYAETQRWAEDNILEIVAVGFDPEKTFILQDTEFVGHTYTLIHRSRPLLENTAGHRRTSRLPQSSGHPQQIPPGPNRDPGQDELVET